MQIVAADKRLQTVLADKRWAEKYPEIISRIVNEGHILGSHFQEHRNYILDRKMEFLNSLNNSIQKIESMLNYTIKYCRIPYGRLQPWQEKWIIKNQKVINL